MNQFMVDIELPQVISADFIALVPQQRKHVEMLMEDGRVLAYTLALDRSHAWMIVIAASSTMVMDILADFPLIAYMKPDIHELAFYDSIPVGLPKMLLN